MTDIPNYTPADEWAADSKVALPGPLKVPSGKTALVRAPGIETFMEQGMVPNSLLGMVRTALQTNSGKKKSPAQERKEMDAMFDEIAQDPTKLTDLFSLVDAAVVYCVVKPVVRPVPFYTEDVIGSEKEGLLGKPMNFEDRPQPQEGQEKFLWVDQVDVEDRMFIFNFACAGTRDVERFRDESAAVLGRAGDGKPVARATKRTAGNTKARKRDR